MAEYEVEVVATSGIFVGLAKQNMLFHQCVGELVDNAIAATNDGQKFNVELVLVEDANGDVDFFVIDQGRGMTLDTLKKALQLGESATTHSRLNEHGFGMKNALATLSGGNGAWQLWTKDFTAATVLRVEGPFGPKMRIIDDGEFPNLGFISTGASTVVRVKVKKAYVRTVQGRGAPANDLAILRSWLIEHLGVMYRGYLELDPTTAEDSGTIYVSLLSGVQQVMDRKKVPPLQIPFARYEKKSFPVTIGGRQYSGTYLWGTLDEVGRNEMLYKGPTKYYYQGNIPTQGIDIRLGKRTIATRQLEAIWKTEDGRNNLARHNDYNDFLGELIIPEVPRGLLTTTNSKTDFNLDDDDWQRIFKHLNSELRPVKNARQKTEAGLRDAWVQTLRHAAAPMEVISIEKAVWPPGVKIDVYRKHSFGRMHIYELKAGKARPVDLYQLKMYWDGLVDAGEFPDEATLLVDDFSTSIDEMAQKMNAMTPPQGSKSYNFRIELHRDKGL